VKAASKRRRASRSSRAVGVPSLHDPAEAGIGTFVSGRSAVVCGVRFARMARRESWLAFAAWTVAGALAVFAFLSGFSIGVFVLPFAVLALAAAARVAGGGAGLLGLPAGAGLVFLLIAALTYDPGDSAPWLLAGLAFVAASSAAFAAARRRAS
jgi:hypothetical protein